MFDGIGGFPLAGLRNGMTTLWASEIEPFPIRVTRIRFPNMKHLGDIMKINGAEIEPVDIITFGSPCQDLSVAGKRAGLAGERSGLFMEAIRIIREMREHEQSIGRTNINIRPRFAVWENVPGAFSSNKGEDFRAVLEETARIADKTVVIPKPPKGKWTISGAIMGDGWSIAWRVLDAQFWGVPQRRRRIFLVADFGGESAPEILFKREGLSRYTAEGGEAREGVAADAERSVDETSNCLTPWDVQSRRIHEASGKWPALYGGEGGGHGYAAIAIDSNCQDSRFKLTGQVVPTIPAKAGTGGNNGPMLAVPQKAYCIQGNCIDRADTAGCNGKGWTEDVCYTLNTIDRPAVAKIDCSPNGIAGTVSSKWAKGTGGPAGDEHYNLVTQKRFGEYEQGCGTLTANTGRAKTGETLVNNCYTVRRLTPLECERLQDFPDGWTDISGTSEVSSEELEFWRAVWYHWDKLRAKNQDKVRPRRDNALLKWLKNPTSDSAQYKALGNSVAVCCPEYVLEGIKEVIERGQIS